MPISGSIRRLLIMNLSSMIIFNYIGIFVNLYIWQANKSIFDVTWFNLVLFISWTFAFAVGSRLLTRFTNRHLIRITAVNGALTFLLLTFLKLDNRLLWIALIAIPVGIMWGLYATTQNITLCVYGKGKDFESYFAYSSIIGQIVSISNPIIFALVIQWIGFAGSFLLMFLFAAVLLTVSYFIPTFTLAREQIPLFRNIRFSEVFSTPALKWMAPSCLAAGVFLQFQGLFALVFTFSVSSDKLVIALLNVSYAASAIAAMILYRRIKLKDGWWLWTGVTFVCIGFLCALYPRAPLLVLSNILTTVGLFYFGTVWNTRQFRIISGNSPMEQARIFLWREWLLNVTRIFTLFLILMVEDLSGVSFMALMIFAIASALSVPFFSGMSERATAMGAVRPAAQRGGAGA